jgi:EAL domain-containing protein (putative c-di-GMP-specific phosphodiesterase class I)
LLRAYLNDGAPVSPPAMFARRTGGEACSLDALSQNTHLHNAARVMRGNEKIFLNFRPETLCVPGYANAFARTVARADLSASRVVIEVVESGGSLHQLADAVEEFRSYGFKIALDDFGAGQSNMDRLFRLAPDIVKLDRSLLVSAMRSSNASVVFLNLVSLLHDAGSSVVVEGIETQADLDFAAAVGADMVQGFYLARPASLRMPYGHAMRMISNARHSLLSSRDIQVKIPSTEVCGTDEDEDAATPLRCRQDSDSVRVRREVAPVIVLARKG